MPVQARDRATLRVFGVLVAGALVGVIGILPYALTLLDELPSSVKDALPTRWILLPLQVLQAMVLLGFATALGLWLGSKVGLGAPMLYGLVSGDREARSHLRALLLPCAALAVLVGVAILLLDLWVFAPRLAAAGSEIGDLQPPAWQGMLASFLRCHSGGAAVATGTDDPPGLVAARLTRTAVPRPAVMWTAIVATALLFGAGHLPTTAAMLSLTPLVIARALLLNGIWGVLFGWLYWKRGLLAAVLAHFSADIVLHVAAPLLTQ